MNYLDSGVRCLWRFLFISEDVVVLLDMSLLCTMLFVSTFIGGSKWS